MGLLGDIALYKTALNHPQVCVREPIENNERLSSMGDAVLSSVITHYLFENAWDKGRLFTEMHGKMVKPPDAEWYRTENGVLKKSPL